MKYIYTGPSWARSSYPLHTQSTNLAKEWNIPFVDASQPASSVLNRVAYIKNLKLNLPIVWIYNEPLNDLESLTGISHAEFLSRSDWLSLWHECNRKCLNAVASLGVPVLLIGGHSDVVDCDHSNIIIGHHSWQKYLAESVNMRIEDEKIHVKMDDGGNFVVDRCWGAEVIHKVMHENPHINPDPVLVDHIWDIFFFWQQLEKSDVFYEVHPNLKGNLLFAQHMIDTVEKFIQDHS